MCTEKGERTYSCTCGHSYIEEISELGHREVPGGTATAHSKCSECGAALTGAEGHSYTTELTKEPTCIEKGERTYSCACGHSYIEEIEATGHSEVSGGTATVHSKCSECGETLTGAEGHSYTSSVTKEPTCTEKGERTYNCTCGHSYIEEISALGHSYISSVTKEPTCTEKGERTYSCTCGHSYIEEIEATGHSEVSGGTATVHSKCSECGETLTGAEGHSYTSSVTKEPTCTEKGEKTYSCTCGHSYTEEITEPGHSEVSGGTATVHSKCSECGETLTGAEGHSYTPSVTKEPTCTEKGERTYSCTCGYSYTEEISELGHSEVSGGTADVHSKCGECGETLTGAEGHSYTSEETISPTCIYTGEKKHTCTCGYSYTESIPALGHTEGTVVMTKAETCTTDSEWTVYCSVCNEVAREYTQPTSGHTKTDPDADVTTCSKCGEKWIDITSNVFPDDAFRSYISANDTNNDGILFGDETEIWDIYIPATTDLGDGYTSLKGIEHFTTLRSLNCSYNDMLTSLDLSGLTELSSLDVTGCVGLKSLDVSETIILELNVSGLPALETLVATDFKGKIINAREISTLTSIDVTNSASLTDLKLSNTGISELDLTGTGVQMLDISGTPIASMNDITWVDTIISLGITDTSMTDIDISSLKELVVLSAANANIDDTDISKMIPTDSSKLDSLILDLNPGITTLDLSACTELRYLSLGGCTGLASLDLSTLTNLELLELSGCTSLTSLDVSTLTNLKTLNINGCTGITSIDLTNNTALESFAAEQSGLVGDLDLSGLTNLNMLILADVAGITSVDVHNISTLTSLNLTGSTNINTVIATDCTNLTNFSFSGDSMTHMYLERTNFTGTNEGTSLDFSAAPIQVLKLDGSSVKALHITLCNDVIEVTVGGCTGLTEINVYNCTATFTIDASTCTMLNTPVVVDSPNVTIIEP